MGQIYRDGRGKLVSNTREREMAVKGSRVDLCEERRWCKATREKELMASMACWCGRSVSIELVKDEKRIGADKCLAGTFRCHS